MDECKPLIHGTAWARALIDTHSEHGTMLRLVGRRRLTLSNRR